MATNAFVSPDSWVDLLFRLVLALVVGAIIGFDRELKHKSAGLRTHMLVSFGSALFVLIPVQLEVTQESANALTRVIQGVATGIGFIGAGVILQEPRGRNNHVRVRGLTTAAAVWTSSALGIAVACGLWLLGLFGALLTLLVLTVFKQFETRAER